MDNTNRSLSFSSCPRKHSFNDSYFEMQHTRLSLEFTFKLENSDQSLYQTGNVVSELKCKANL